MVAITEALVLVFCLGILDMAGLCSSNAQVSPVSDVDRMWSRIAIQQGDRGPRTPRPSNQFASVTFLDDQRLAVAEEDRTGQLSDRGRLSGSSAFVLRMQVLNASTGSTALSLSWPTRALESSVQAVPGGLLVRTGPILRFYTSELRQISEIPLEHESAGEWAVSISNSRQTVLLNHYDSRHSHFELLNGGTGKVNRTWESPSPLRPPYSISDEAIVKSDLRQQQVLFSRFGSQQWVVIPVPFKIGCATSPVWLTANLLVNADCREVSIISFTGDVLMRVATSAGGSFESKVALSQDGRYLAAQRDEGKGGGFLDRDVRRTATQLVIYDVSLKKPIVTVNVSPLPIRNYDFALSPDGSKLAVLSDNTINVYRVKCSSKVCS
jgi:hypothetical protein